MIPYAERVCFRSWHLLLYGRAVALVDRLSDTWGNELRCHELVRALAWVLTQRNPDDDWYLNVVDGKCGPVEHSWLRCRDGTILDPYAPGRIPSVQLIDVLMGVRLYEAGEIRNDIREEIVERLIVEMTPSPVPSR